MADEKETADARKPSRLPPPRTATEKATAAARKPRLRPRLQPRRRPPRPRPSRPRLARAREQVLKVHHLRPAAGAKKDRTRVGRGEGSKGKTAGRGTKGTKARYQVRPGFEGGQMPCTCVPRSCAASRTRSASSTRS